MAPRLLQSLGPAGALKNAYDPCAPTDMAAIRNASFTCHRVQSSVVMRRAKPRDKNFIDSQNLSIKYKISNFIYPFDSVQSGSAAENACSLR
jgi:hypothetical protein